MLVKAARESPVKVGQAERFGPFLRLDAFVPLSPPQPIGGLLLLSADRIRYPGRPARLRAKVQRYRCRAGNETFLQPLGGIVDDRRTAPAARFILFARKSHVTNMLA